MSFANLFEYTTGYTNSAISNYEVGTKFSASVDGNITALRFYKTGTETGTHTGRVWSAGGTLLASVVFSGETASGWQQQALVSPLAITAGTTYIVSFNVNAIINYVNNGFSTLKVDSSNQLTIPATGGVFVASAGTFPNTANTAAYGSSIVFDNALGGSLFPGSASLSSRAVTPSATITTTAPNFGTSPYTYQWQVSTDNVSFANISGATTVTYTYSPGASGLYYFRCVYGDAAAGSATSNTIAVVLSNTQIFIGFVGDSITAGTLANSPPSPTTAANVLERLYGSRMVRFNNAGIASSYTPQWLPGQTNYSNAITAFNADSSGIANKYVSIMSVNDAYNPFGPLSKATHKANLSSICQGFISNGYKVILNYPLWTSAVDRPLSLLLQYQEAINELIDGVNILQGDILGYQYFLQNPTQLVDGLHPNQTGENNLGTLWAYGFWNAVYSTKAVASVSSTRRKIRL